MGDVIKLVAMTIVLVFISGLVALVRTSVLVCQFLVNGIHHA